MNDVEFSYDEQNEPALLDIDLRIERGEFIGIVGANGSGKSTLAKLLNVLLVPDEGEVYIDGKLSSNPDNTWEIRQNVGLVFQNPDNQLVATLVEDDVAFGPENLALPSAQIRKRVDTALAQVNMEGYQSHPPHKLSGGQKQRVAIAGIIAMLPDCLVLDEPTAMLDPQGRREVLQTVKRLNRDENITVVYITHFMEEVVAADRIVVMDSGKILSVSPPSEVFSDSQLIAEAGLEVPPAVELAAELRTEGIDIPQVLTPEGLVDALC